MDIFTTRDNSPLPTQTEKRHQFGRKLDGLLWLSFVLNRIAKNIFSAKTILVSALAFSMQGFQTQYFPFSYKFAIFEMGSYC